MEYVIPIFFKQTAMPFYYCCTPYLLVLDDSDTIENRAKIIWSEYNELFTKANRQRMAVVEPAYLLHTMSDLKERYPYRINFSSQFQKQSSSAVITLVSDPPRSFFGNISLKVRL